jgi:hypothetical protein
MRLPVRPPTLFAASVAALPTLLAAELADEETRDRPSDALDETLDEASAAFSFAAPAASDVVEALRRPARRTAKVERRSTWREAARDIVTGSGRELAMGWMRVGVLGLEVGSFGCQISHFSGMASTRTDRLGGFRKAHEMSLPSQHHGRVFCTLICYLVN